MTSNIPTFMSLTSDGGVPVWLWRGGGSGGSVDIIPTYVLACSLTLWELPGSQNLLERKTLNLKKASFSGVKGHLGFKIGVKIEQANHELDRTRR